MIVLEICESLNGKLGDELLGVDILYALKEAQILIEQWRKTYTTVRCTAPWAIAPAPETMRVDYKVTPEGKGVKRRFTNLEVGLLGGADQILQLVIFDKQPCRAG